MALRYKLNSLKRVNRAETELAEVEGQAKTENQNYRSAQDTEQAIEKMDVDSQQREH